MPPGAWSESGGAAVGEHAEAAAELGVAPPSIYRGSRQPRAGAEPARRRAARRAREIHAEGGAPVERIGVDRPHDPAPRCGTIRSWSRWPRARSAPATSFPGQVALAREVTAAGCAAPRRRVPFAPCCSSSAVHPPRGPAAAPTRELIGVAEGEGRRHRPRAAGRDAQAPPTPTSCSSSACQSSSPRSSSCFSSRHRPYVRAGGKSGGPATRRGCWRRRRRRRTWSPRTVSSGWPPRRRSADALGHAGEQVEVDP